MLSPQPLCWQAVVVWNGVMEGEELRGEEQNREHSFHHPPDQSHLMARHRAMKHITSYHPMLRHANLPAVLVGWRVRREQTEESSFQTGRGAQETSFCSIT